MSGTAHLARVLPSVDVETYVPSAITVVRRSVKWPGIVVHERRGKAGRVNYPGGIRQHVFYLFLRPLKMDVVLGREKRVVNYKAGEARFTPAGQSVSFRWSGEVQVLMVGFEPWFFSRVAAELGSSAIFPAETNNSKLAADHPACLLMHQLRRELDGSAGAAFAAEGLARAIVVLLLREFDHIPAIKPDTPAPPLAVLQVVAVMRQRLTESLSLEELASVARLSPFHFARQFKAATGHPPHEYLIRLRVDRAQELIRQHHRKWSLAAVANECGFADQSHMARHFKRVLGLNPGEFADACGARSS